MIPILKPEFVAERAVAAVLANQEMVILPGWAAPMGALKVQSLEGQSYHFNQEVYVYVDLLILIKSPSRLLYPPD